MKVAPSDEQALGPFYTPAEERMAAEITRLRALVKRAFNEGVGAGMDEFTKSRGGITWEDSKSRAALKGDTHE